MVAEAGGVSRAILALSTPVRRECKKPGTGALATLHVVETADHSFHVLKSENKNDAQVVRELAQVVASWADGGLVANPRSTH